MTREVQGRFGGRGTKLCLSLDGLKLENCTVYFQLGIGAGGLEWAFCAELGVDSFGPY